jgi:hypothetical protein
LTVIGRDRLQCREAEQDEFGRQKTQKAQRKALQPLPSGFQLSAFNFLLFSFLKEQGA